MFGPKEANEDLTEIDEVQGHDANDGSAIETNSGSSESENSDQAGKALHRMLKIFRPLQKQATCTQPNTQERGLSTFPLRTNRQHSDLWVDAKSFVQV